MDQDGLNLIHHALLTRQSDLLRLVIMKGVYQEMEQPDKYPYMPLAAYVGRSSMINILLEHRPNDVHKKCYLSDFKLFDKLGDYTIKDGYFDKNMPVSALDIAALKKNLKCVELLLNSVALKLPLKLSLVERCVEAQSLESLALFLEQNSPTKSEISRSFKMALLRKLASYVELLLRYTDQVSCKTVLNGMNPYHVMYMYSSAFQVINRKDRFMGIVETTEVLLKQQFSVSDNVPAGSYPLYSLLYSLALEMDQSMSGMPQHHMDTLHLLLSSRASPNYNECQDLDISGTDSGDILYDLTTSTACGRGLYKSALDAVFQSLSECHTWKQESTPCMEQVVKMLLNHGVILYDTVIHQLMQFLALQHNHGNAVDLSCVISLLLKRGACLRYINEESSTTVETVSLIYPTSAYFDSLLSYQPNMLQIQKIKANKVIAQVMNLFQYIDSSMGKQARKELSFVFERFWMSKTGEETQSEGAALSLYTHIEKYLRKLQQPKDLLLLCTLVVWKCIDRRPGVMDLLKLPKNMKLRMLSVFDRKLHL